MKIFTILILITVLLTACNPQTILQECEQDSDCIPLPTECHTSTCISKEGVVVKPMACTEIYMLEAAYSPEDCICIKNVCTNKNLGRTTLENPVEIIIESPEEKIIIGGDTDDHGCLIGAGYSWCETKEKCLRIWEEECPGLTLNPSECENSGGRPVNSMEGCLVNEKSIGDVVGFISPNICCVENECLEGECETKEDTREEEYEICKDQCGDGKCDRFVCMGEGCPCREDHASCPMDC